MPSYKLRTLLLVAVAALVLAACGENAGTKGGKTGEAKAGPGVVANVNGKELTIEDLKTEAASLSPMAVKALSDKNVRDKVLDNMVVKQLIMQEADKSGLAKDPEVAKKLDQLKSSLLIEVYIKKNVVDKVNVTDQSVQDYFNKNKQDLGSVRLSHIVVGSEAEAASVLAKAKSGEDFGKLAKQYSLDTKTKDKGGDLGYVKWDQFGNPSLKDAAFKLKKGELSGIVQSQFGYHIMKVTDKKPAADSEFAMMKDQLTKQLGDQMKRELFESTVKGLKDKAKVATFKEALDKADFGAPEGSGPAKAMKEEAGKAPSKK